MSRIAYDNDLTRRHGDVSSRGAVDVVNSAQNRYFRSGERADERNATADAKARAQG